MGLEATGRGRNSGRTMRLGGLGHLSRAVMWNYPTGSDTSMTTTGRYVVPNKALIPRKPLRTVSCNVAGLLTCLVLPASEPSHCAIDWQQWPGVSPWGSGKLSRRARRETHSSGSCSGFSPDSLFNRGRREGVVKRLKPPVGHHITLCFDAKHAAKIQLFNEKLKIINEKFPLA